MVIIKKAGYIKQSEVTPKSVYLDRRRYMQQAVTSSLLLSADAILPVWARKYLNSEWPALKQGPYSSTDKVNSLKDITTYNNFYEFGTGKKDPHKNATEFLPHPWRIYLARSVF